MVNVRRKGHDFERLVAKLVSPVFPKARRGRQEGGARESDVVTDPWLWLECKKGQLRLTAALKQANRDALRAHPVPLVVAVVHKQNHGEELVTMRLSVALQLFQLMKEACEEKEEAKAKVGVGEGGGPRKADGLREEPGTIGVEPDGGMVQR